MTVEFRLPDVGEGLDEAEIVRWLVGVGDEVARDQSMVEIQTDKALVEIPTPEAGVVEKLEGEEGEMVKVGDLLFVVGNGSPRAAPGRRRAKAAPAVRRRARASGIDLTEIQGTGAGGRVTSEDLERAAAGASAASSLTAPPDESVRPAGSAAALSGGGSAARGQVVDARLGQAPFGAQPLRGIRRATAKAMAASWSTIPHIHGWDEIDATSLLETRRKLRKSAGEAGELLTPMPFLLLAAARALRRYPLVNASLDMEREEIVVHEDIHVGIAVATSDGLIVPVVRHADRRSLLDLGREVARLSEAARTRRVRPEELRGGTFTISNYGSLGGRFASPIVRPPEAGILGFGAVRERPLVVDGEIRARPTLPVCFGADHRLIDGDLSVAFQELVKGLLSDPVELLLGE